MSEPIPDVIQGPQGVPGVPGALGLNDYDLWLMQGFEGTELDYQNWKKGEQGAAGPKGLDGTDGLEGLPGPRGFAGAPSTVPPGPRGRPGGLVDAELTVEESPLWEVSSETVDGTIKIDLKVPPGGVAWGRGQLTPDIAIDALRKREHQGTYAVPDAAYATGAGLPVASAGALRVEHISGLGAASVARQEFAPTGDSARWSRYSGPAGPATLLRTNLCPNPRPGSADGYIASIAGLVVTPEAGFARGTTTTAGTNRGIRTPLGAIDTPGAAYVARLQVRYSVPGITLTVRPDRWSATAQVSTAAGVNIATTGDWQDVVVPVADFAGSPATHFRLSVFRPASSAVGDTLDVRRVLYEKGTGVPGPYFDGGTPPTAEPERQQLVRAWTAVTDASTSTESRQVAAWSAWVEEARGPTGATGAVGPYGGTAVTDPQLAALVGTASGQARQALNDSYAPAVDINVMDPRWAVPASPADATAALTAVMVYAGDRPGSSVLIPPRTDLTFGDVPVPSDVTVRWDRAVLRIKTGAASLYRLVGTTAAQVALGAVATTGGKTLTTATAHGLAAGDLIRLMSQRNAMGDSGEQWRLGSGTAPAYYAEFHRVAAVPTSTTITLAEPIVFPDYRPDATAETGILPRPAATVEKVNSVRRTRLTGRAVVIGALAADQAAVFCDWSEDCLIEQPRFEMTNDGAFIQIQRSYNTWGSACSGEYLGTGTSALETARTGYRVISSHECGYRDHSSVIKGSQGFDVSYNSVGLGVCLNVEVRGCHTRNNTSGGMTTHSGTFGSVVADNRFLDCLTNGLSIRSRQATVTGNKITGPGEPGGTNRYGIQFFEGWARDSVISNNSITAFADGIVFRDGSSNAGMRWGWIGCQVVGNIINQYRQGIYVDRAAGAPTDGSAPGANVFAGPVGLNIMNNTIVGCWAQDGKGILLDPYLSGVVVEGNTIDLSGVGNAGIRLTANCTDNRVASNTIINSRQYGVWLDGPTTGTARVDLGGGNRIINALVAAYFKPVTVTVGVAAGALP